MTKVAILAVFVGFSLFVGSQLLAESVLGSKDAEGNITYSDSVPSDAVRTKTIELEPQKVSPADHAQSQQEAAEMTRKANELSGQSDASKTAEKAAAEETAMEQSNVQVIDADPDREAEKELQEKEARDSESAGSPADRETTERTSGAEAANSTERH